MPKIYKLSRTGLRLFYKIRHHRGHGVHSPFVFSLITKVIEEKLPYYGYADINESIKNQPSINKTINKYDLLSFRLVNYFNSTRILELGAGEGVNTLCLTSPISKSECICVEMSKQKTEKAKLLLENWNRNITLCGEPIKFDGDFDCIYINLRNFEIDYDSFINNVLPYVHQNSFIVIKGLRTKKANHVLWKKITTLPQVTISLDLYHLGILFFKPRLFRESFKISF